MSYLESQENKQLLWGILDEEGIFDSVPESVGPEEVKHVFERIIRNISASIPALLATRLKELYISKERAIAEEDYDAAKTIRASIERIEAPSGRILKLEQRKQTAIQAEDYESAKQIKLEIDRIRAAAFSLTELNKIAIQSLATGIPKITADIHAIKSGRGGGHTNLSNAHLVPFHSSSDIYNAEDFQSQKRKEIELKMREKESEMRSFLEVPRPAEIDFSDRQEQPRLKSSFNIHANSPPPSSASATPTVELVHLDYNGASAPNPGSDSPISDDMDKLIAERIASRERDLAEISEKIKRSSPASDQTPGISQYSNTDTNVRYDVMIMRKPAPPPTPEPGPGPEPEPRSEYNVRFAETPDIIQEYEPEQQHAQIEHAVPDVYSRLKRKTT